jgi:hypothetical protein
MGKRAAIATTEAEVLRLTLAQLNQQIAKTEHRVNSVSNAALRKSAFRLLIWQEAQRETLHGIPAPTREAP